MRTPAAKEAVNLYTKWIDTARDKQIAPEDPWNVWLILAGRGWGKTRTGAQDIVNFALRYPNTISAVVAPTFGDLRRVCFGGPSGIITLIPDDCMPIVNGRRKRGYSTTTSEIRLYNGSIIIGFAAIEPERLRGPQFHRAWCDEVAAWRYPEAMDQLMFGLRLGQNPKCIITTTPKPSRLIKDLVARDDVYVTRGSTFENADNLAPAALEALKERYEGTALGRQELYAEIVDDVEGALWTIGMIESNRVQEPVDMSRIIVAIDPAVTSGNNSDETGIVVSGKGSDGQYYVLEDASGRMSPDEWARTAVRCYYRWEADRIVAEVNNGGDLVERLLRTVDSQIPYTPVSATRGKLVRAEPVAALYEQGKVHHVGVFGELEDQMCTFVGELRPSPARMDALVWGLGHLSRSSGQANWRIN